MYSYDASSARRRTPGPEVGMGVGVGVGSTARDARALRTSAAGLAAPGQQRWRPRWRHQAASAAPAVSRAARTCGWVPSPWAYAPWSGGSPCAPLGPSIRGRGSMRRSGRALVSIVVDAP
eukprot:scaffold25420_cov58-Phaeocystis_antarctica.AAC.2